MPDRISCREHEAIIDSLLASDDERTVIKRHQEDASEMFSQALRYGQDRKEWSRVQLAHYNAAAGRTGQLFVLVGDRINRRINLDALKRINPGETGLVTYADDVRNGAQDNKKKQAVLGALAPEIALFVTVRALKADVRPPKEVGIG